MSLDVARVTFRRGGRMLIDGIDCTIPPGGLTALVGPNGAGKSTLLQLIAGAQHPDEGRMWFAGAELRGLGRRARAQTIALVEQQSDTELDLSVRDVVGLGRTPYLTRLAGPRATDDAIVARALSDVGASDLASRRFRELSGGQRQRVALARALAQQPQLILLDEPTNHLDVHAQLETMALLERLAASGLTVLAALHDLGHAAGHADHVIMIAAGRVVAAGTPTEVLTPLLVERVYGVRTVVLTNPLTGRPVFAYGGTNATAPSDHSIGRAGARR